MKPSDRCFRAPETIFEREREPPQKDEQSLLRLLLDARFSVLAVAFKVALRMAFIWGHVRLAVQTSMTRDPVCNMMVDESKTTLKSEHDGRVLYFCSTGCKAAFDKDPHRYGHVH
jgi:YHS domain-containing protein